MYDIHTNRHIHTYNMQEASYQFSTMEPRWTLTTNDAKSYIFRKTFNKTFN